MCSSPTFYKDSIKLVLSKPLSTEESQGEVISEIHQKAVSLLINLKSPEERADESRMNSVERMDIAADHPMDEADGSARGKVTSHKRKQDRFLVELHEKAEVCSEMVCTCMYSVQIILVCRT